MRALDLGTIGATPARCHYFGVDPSVGGSPRRLSLLGRRRWPAFRLTTRYRSLKQQRMGRVSPRSPGPGRPTWTNLVPESLVSSVEINGQSAALHWRPNQIASSADSHKVAFVYETESPPYGLNQHPCGLAVLSVCQSRRSAHNFDCSHDCV